MAIIKPSQMDFSGKKFSMIIAGPPGIGKTTMALSAPNPILIDFDQGVSRVKAQHRKDTIISANYEEVLEDMKNVDSYETIIIDTGGSFITYLQDWAMRQNPKNRKTSGGISQTGFGAVKAEFVNFTNRLKYTMQKNVIYIFHTVEEKDSSGEIVNRLLCEGSSRNIVWQPCDFGCFVHMSGNNRVAGFTPTEQYFAKGCHGIHGLIHIPTLDDKTPNTFISNLLESAKENISLEAAVAAEQMKQYEKVIAEGNALIESIADEETAMRVTNGIKALAHSLTSEKELRSTLLSKVRSLGMKYSKEVGAYVRV